MAYTSIHLTAVDAAISTFISGTRVGRVSIAGKSIDYAQTSLTELQAIRKEITSEINVTAGAKRFFLTSTSKGL